VTLLETFTADDVRTSATPARGPAIVVLPTYNEAANIGGVLCALLAVDARIEVLVVDDSSPDGTSLIVEGIAEEHRGRVHLLSRPAKSGLGSAYRSGFMWAAERRYELVVQMDADGSHPPDRLPLMLDLAESRVADLVIGSRYVAGGRTEGWPLTRRLLSRGANAYARAVLGLEVKDATGGFRVWRLTALAAADPSAATADGYGFLVELAAAAQRRGLQVLEVPIIFKDRTLGESKMTGAVAVEAATRLWALRRRGLRLHRPLSGPLASIPG
jgi:dolichol-phosphate mannosyltransferase